MKRLFSVLIIAVLMLTGCAESGGTEGGLTSFSAYDLNGEAQSQEIFQGKKLTMVNFWATYCGPCIEEMPALAALDQELAGQGFQVVGIIGDVTDYEGSAADTARDILKTANADYVNLLPSQNLQAFLQQFIYVPTTVFVDETGTQIGEPYVGSRSKADWQAIITELLGEVA